MSQITNNTLRQIFFLLVIIILGLIIFLQLQTFIPALLGAYTLYVILRKYMFILQARYKWKRALAAALLMFISFIVILLPIFILINMLSSKIAFAVQHSSEVLTSIKAFIKQYETRYNFELLSDANIKRPIRHFLHHDI